MVASTCNVKERSIGTYDKITVAIGCGQEACIDRLLIKWGMDDDDDWFYYHK